MGIKNYRKKPVVIQAIQYDGSQQSFIEVDKFVTKPLERLPGDNKPLFIPTLEGKMEASPGDWIIKGVQGEFYPCKPDIFEETYELSTSQFNNIPIETPRTVPEIRVSRDFEPGTLKEVLTIYHDQSGKAVSVVRPEQVVDALKQLGLIKVRWPASELEDLIKRGKETSKREKLAKELNKAKARQAAGTINELFSNLGLDLMQRGVGSRRRDK